MNPPLAEFLAQAALAFHALYVLWNVFGILFAMRWPRLRWVHLSTLAIALGFMLSPWYCPLTYLENWLWEMASPSRASVDSFISHYLEKMIYWNVSPIWIGLLTGLYNLFCLWFYLFSNWTRSHKK